MRKRLPAQTYIEGILAGDRIRLSQAITLVESRLPADRVLARKIVQSCLQAGRSSYRIGITGVPGVGKSTFIDSFGQMLIEQGHKVAVLAVDPSSEKHKGSILGDKTRMSRLSHSAQAYVRPSPTAGTLGGVAAHTREAMLLCEAAGFDLILIETVGVGQSEIAVHRMVDFFLMLHLPNAGDDLQGIKKGIMEMVHALVINKADGAQLPAARRSFAQLSQAIRLLTPHEADWRPPVWMVSSTEETGLGDIWEGIQRYAAPRQADGRWEAVRRKQASAWLDEIIWDQLQQRFLRAPVIQARLHQLREAVISREKSPVEAAEVLLDEWLGETQ